MKLSFFRRILVALIMSATVSGCVTRIPQAPINLSPDQKVPGDESVVFGRVEVFKDGKTFDWKPNPEVVAVRIYTFSPDFFKVFVKEEAAQKEFTYLLVGNGSFYWHLPAGRYAITGYLYNSGGTYVKTDFLPGRTPEFMIEKGGSVIYLGTLVIDMHPTGKDAMQIVDDYDEALQRLKSNFPDLRPGPEIRLMTLH